jgi:cytochrome c-type biogenesis protein CcsB
MSRVIQHDDLGAISRAPTPTFRLNGLAPVLVGIGAGLALIAARALTPVPALADGPLVVLALLAYLTASVLHLIHLYVREPWVRQAGIWLAGGGLALNIASWGIRWIQAGEMEHWRQWLWRYVPLANLYDITVAFVFVAVIFTLVIERRPKYAAVGALTLPVATLLLMLAVFLGNEQRTLTPILDSYWRPIHVGFAATSYGVCLVSFGLAILYLIRDGARMSTIGAWVAGLGVFFYLFIDHFGILTASYSAGLMIGTDPIPMVGGGSLRVPVPYAGPLLLASMLSILAAGVVLAVGSAIRSESVEATGMKLVKVSIVVQAIAIATTIYLVTSLSNLPALASAESLKLVGAKMAEQAKIDVASVPTERLIEAGRDLLAANAADLDTNIHSNPIEMAAMITVLVAMILVLVLSLNPTRVLDSMPSLRTIDSLTYLSVAVAFPLLSMLLVTGAVWANESWGRYWGWDNKEVGALVTWLAYAAYLHTRIAHGWAGRRSAYFAIGGFGLVIFTYLGVSYLLPGLHSYAGG